MTGSKIRLEYLSNQEYEIVKIRKINDALTLVDFKDVGGFVGTINSAICKTVEGKDLYEAIKEQEVLKLSSSVETVINA
jgi:hypothetical protein